MANVGRQGARACARWAFAAAVLAGLASCSRVALVPPEAYPALRTGQEVSITYLNRRVVRGVLHEMTERSLMLSDWRGGGRMPRDRSLLRIEWDEVYEIERVEFDAVRTLASVGSFLAIPVTVATVVAIKRRD